MSGFLRNSSSACWVLLFVIARSPSWEILHSHIRVEIFSRTCRIATVIPSSTNYGRTTVAKESPVESITFVPRHTSIADADITQMPVWHPVAEVILHAGAHNFEPLGQLMPRR